MTKLRKQFGLDYSFLNRYYYSDNTEKPFQFTKFTKSEFELCKICENFTIWQRIKTYIFLIRGIERQLKWKNQPFAT